MAGKTYSQLNIYVNTGKSAIYHYSKKHTLWALRDHLSWL